MTSPTLSEKVKEILADIEIDEGCLGINITKKAHQAIMEAIRESVPKPLRAHTYASENADLYRAFDRGFKACREEMLRRLK